MSDHSSPILSLPPFSSASISRLQALYSDISRHKHSNPTSYNFNVEWWRRVLELVVSSGMQTETSSHLLLVCGPRLMEQVRVKGVGKPLALGAVVTELQSTMVLIARSEFLCAEKPIYDAGWLPTRIATFVVGKPLWWALEQMGVVGEEGVFGRGIASRSPKDTAWWGEYVFVPLVEKAADAILERQAAKMGGVGNRLYSMDMFRHEFGSVLGVDVLSDVDVMVLLKFLERDRSALVFDKEVVKFLSDNVSNHGEINAVDRGILELRNSVQNLHAQVDGLQFKMDECTKKATAAVQQKQKALALSHLRLKKELEDLLSKRLGSLDNLESTLLRVEAAAGDIEIMKTYESSAATLRVILAHPSLQRDAIEATIEALAEANVDAKEVDDAVRKGADNAFGVEGIDNGELEEELKALVLESEKEKEKEQEQEELDNVKELSERLRALPNAPDVSLPTEATHSKIAQT